MSNLVFAIDYDGTWTRARHELTHFVVVAQRCGHTCVMVTARDGKETDPEWARRLASEVRREIGDLMPVLFTNHGAKRPVLDAWLLEQRKVNVHVIWIDDTPSSIEAPDPRMMVNR